jgi:hypothetical protein
VSHCLSIPLLQRYKISASCYRYFTAICFCPSKSTSQALRPHIFLFPCSPRRFLSPSIAVTSRSFPAIDSGHLLSTALKVEFLLQSLSRAVLAHLQRCLLFIVSFPPDELLIAPNFISMLVDRNRCHLHDFESVVWIRFDILPLFRRDASRFLTSLFFRL